MLLKTEPMALRPITKALALQGTSPRAQPSWKMAARTSGCGYKATARSADARLTKNKLPGAGEREQESARDPTAPSLENILLFNQSLKMNYVTVSIGVGNLVAFRDMKFRLRLCFLHTLCGLGNLPKCPNSSSLIFLICRMGIVIPTLYYSCEDQMMGQSPGGTMGAH